MIPSKIFECMSMGIPLVHGVEGESAEIVEREQAGIPFVPEDPNALLAALRRLQGDPALCLRFRENGKRAAHKYDRRTLAMAMLASLKDLR